MWVNVSAFESDEFRRLQKQWYATLARTGFKDIEHTDWKTGEQSLREYGVSRPVDDRKVQYYRRAREYARLLERDCDIWRLHSEGYTARRIGEALARTWPDLGSTDVDNAIRYLRRRMLLATRAEE